MSKYIIFLCDTVQFTPSRVFHISIGTLLALIDLMMNKKKYSRMLVFLWDDSGRIQEHQTFKNAVDGLENIIGSIVIPRPGMMI